MPARVIMAAHEGEVNGTHKSLEMCKKALWLTFTSALDTAAS